VYYLRYVYTWIGYRPRALFVRVISTTFSKTKNFSRSQPVAYTLNVEISWKRYQIESLLLIQTTNSKWYNGQLGANPLSSYTASLQMWFCPRDAMFARLLSSRVRLSVCLFVTSRSCNKTATRQIRRQRCRNSVIFWCKRHKWLSMKFRWNHPQQGSRDAAGVEKSCVLRSVQKSPAKTHYRRKFVHPPWRSASTTVRWCKSKSDDHSYGPVDINVTSLLGSFFWRGSVLCGVELVGYHTIE